MWITKIIQFLHKCRQNFIAIVNFYEHWKLQPYFAILHYSGFKGFYADQNRATFHCPAGILAAHTNPHTSPKIAHICWTISMDNKKIAAVAKILSKEMPAAQFILICRKIHFSSKLMPAFYTFGMVAKNTSPN